MSRLWIPLRGKRFGLRFAAIDAADYPLVSGYKWHAAKGRKTLYAVSSLRGTTTLMHRLLVVGCEEVDHRDGDGLNNARGNLRPATRSQNRSNATLTIGRSSRFRGVGWAKRDKRWEAFISVLGKKVGLGYFTEEKKAALAYDIAAIALRGEFARPNFSEAA